MHVLDILVNVSVTKRSRRRVDDERKTRVRSGECFGRHLSVRVRQLQWT